MNNTIKTNEDFVNLKSQLLMDIYNGGYNAIVASRKLVDLEVAEELNKLSKIIEENDKKVKIYDEFIESDILLSLDEAARVIGVGKTTMLKILKDVGVFIDDTRLSSNGKQFYGSRHNFPSNEYCKYFSIEKHYARANGKCLRKVCVKPEGMKFLLDIIKTYK